MHREVSLAVEIGVALIAIAAMIGIIWFTVFLGRGVANDASFSASDIMSRTAVATLDSLESRCTYPETDSFIALCTKSGDDYYVKETNMNAMRGTTYVGVEMPLAAVNSVLIQNADNIPYFVCCCKDCVNARNTNTTTGLPKQGWVRNLGKETSCLLNHLGQNMGASKVELIVGQEASGNYFVIMRPIA